MQTLPQEGCNTPAQQGNERLCGPLALPWVYRNTTVILLSWYLYPDIERVVSREQVLICPNGIPEIPESENIPKRNNAVPRLLFLSNLIPSKGVYVLLDACKMLKDKGLQFVCNFVGGETKEINREIFEEEVRKRGLDEIVAYQGPKYGKDKEICWHDADVFVQPTFEDCFPLTVVEAMQHGKPVVSTNEGAIPDMVKDVVNGFVCHRQDVLSLAEALEKLVSNPTLCRQMGLRGYERYKNEYTLTAFERRFVEVMKTCL